ncbi:MAG: sigma-70 family RNA polymerase sigma factor [Planctomycetota bacterium]|jgi:RNA polymerase sigma factor (sigma-70 family)
MTDPRTDGELLTAHLAGNASAFEELARRHSATVFGVVRRLLGPGPDAEDAAQATFVLLARKARKLAGRRELGAWLHRSAQLVARSALRARGRRVRHEREAAAMRPASDENRERQKLWNEQTRRLDAAIDSLPERYRQVLVLCYFEKLSQSQAARRLAVPESTVATRCSRGLEKLRGKLAGRRGERLGAAALAALLLERPAEAVPEGFVPSVVTAATGAAVSAPVLALTEGALSMLFWSKMKAVAAAIAVAGLVAVTTPFAVRAAGGDASGTRGGPDVKAVAADEPVPVDGLKLSLSLAPDRIACGAACAKVPAGRPQKCTSAGCIGHTFAGKHCWDCGVGKTLCMVCGKKAPAAATRIESFKAGDQVRLALTLENVAKKKLTVCRYLLGACRVEWQFTGPDAASVAKVPTGMAFMLAPPTKRDFPELAPGERLTVGVVVRGNPPAVAGFSPTRTCLLKPGLYKVTASYVNGQDSYYDSRQRGQVKIAGVWKNTVRSQVLRFKITGAVNDLPRRPILRPMP